MRKRTLVAAVFAVLLVALLVLAFVDFDAPELGETVLANARETTGLPLRSSRARVNLLRGLTLEDVRSSAELGFGAYEVHVERIVFAQRPLALLTGRFALARVTIDQPRILIRLGSPSDASTTPPVEHGETGEAERGESPGREPARENPSSFWKVELTPLEVRLEGGDVVLRDRDGGAGPFSLDDLSLTLRGLGVERRAITLLHGLTAEGDLRLGDLGLRRLDVRNLSTAIALDHGRVRLDPLRFSTERGELEGGASFDFNSLPFRYRLSLTASSFEVPVLGRGAMSLDAEGFGTESRHLKGEGTLRLERGTFPDARFVRDVDPALVGAGFDPADVSFQVADDRLTIASLSLVTPQRPLALEGFADLSGDLHFVLTVGSGEEATTVSLEGTARAPEVTRRRGR